MSKHKPLLVPQKKTASIVRSSAAEYLSFVAASGTGGVEVVYADENIWLTQKMMGTLYDVETHTINYHLKKVFSDSELHERSVIRKFRITAADGKHYDTQHYNLAAIIAVGYKVNSERAVQFRKWATAIIEEFTIKSYTMDDERLMSGGSTLSDQYFEEQLRRIREVRLSERKFYQKITDIYGTAVDYDLTAQATKRFSPPYKTSCTGPFTGRRRPRSSFAAPMPKRQTWGLRPGRTDQKEKSRNSTSRSPRITWPKTRWRNWKDWCQHIWTWRKAWPCAKSP